MTIATVSDARTLGNLPASDKIDDTLIQPHLDAAGRELKSWIGEYESTSDTEKQENCKEAECCLCIAYLLPVLNTLYTDGVVSLQKEIGEVDLMFHSPGDTEKVVEQWTERARSRTAIYINQGGDKATMRWHAI